MIVRMPDPETIALRKTLIGGKTYPDDYTVIWRELPIGRIMRAPGLPPHVPAVALDLQLLICIA
jgi:hypothetical protein